MSQLCVVPTCKIKSSTLCLCCQKNFCHDHLTEHNELIRIGFECLKEEMINLNEEMKMIDLEKLIEVQREKLDQWKDNCHEMIECYYKQKCDELQQFSREKFEKQRKELSQIETSINNYHQNETILRKDLQSLKLSLYDLRQEIDQFKRKGIQITIQPFLLNNQSISIEDSKPNAFHINHAVLTSPDRTIECTNGWQSEFASNDRSILITLADNLCLFDRNLTLIKQSPWPFEGIYDMCWSSTLASFIVVTEKKKVYRINEVTLATERIYGIEEKDWLACTCSEAYLYLTTYEIGTDIFQYKLLPLIRPVKQWQPPFSCKPHESIHTIRSKDRTLALIIRESSGGAIDIELRSSTTLNRLWSLPLDIRSSGLWSRINCCSLQYNEWLVVHTATSRLFHIDKEGQLKFVHEYQPKLNNATMFGSNTLVIHLGSKVHFHQLS
ncbi:unnamed protein product [Adineta ricciae]|uniref:Uncharacterized protein n=1 Tax=Adineta ricciae TaxID=249248 RepID=A0A813VP30_ADIRI|nr:unnamed protein product [Adineta ricciae]CAF1179432.1 unnamed protein product [Adineta ricciae]